MSLEEYRKSRVPFAFVAVGHNLFAGDSYHHAEALSALLSTAAERGDPFSVRNDGSLLRTRRDVGAAADTIVEVPDPGFFVDAPPVRPDEIGARPYVLLQVAGDSFGLRLRSGAQRRSLWQLRTPGKEAFAASLADYSRRMEQDFGMDVLVSTHIYKDGVLAAEILNQLYRGAGTSAAHRPFRLGGTPHPMHAKRFFGSYAAADLVVGMRGHAVICGVGLRRPVVALSTHPKIAGFMQACDLQDWSATLSPDLAEDLYVKSASVLGEKRSEYFAKRDHAVAGFAARLDGFLAHALERAGRSR